MTDSLNLEVAHAEWDNFIAEVERFGNGIFFNTPETAHLFVEVMRDYVLRYFVNPVVVPPRFVQVGLLTRGYLECCHFLLKAHLLDADLIRHLHAIYVELVENGELDPRDLHIFHEWGLK